MGDFSDDIASRIVQELLSALKRGEAEAVYFNFCDCASSVFRGASVAPGFFSRDHMVKESIHWKLSDIHKQKLKQMGRVDRYFKALNKSYPGRVQIRGFCEGNSIEILSTQLEKVASKTYQRGLGVSFTNNSEFQSRLALNAAKLRLFAQVLHIDDEPVAFYLGTKYKSTLFLGHTGYDARYRKFSPGTILLQNTINNLDSDEIHEIDFGFGDASYKRRFCDHSWMESSFYIFGPTFRAIGINLVRTVFLFVGNLLRFVVRKARAEDVVKRLWRNRLSAESE
jgi:hypothetical protein